jgi:hypothetical protein
MAVGEPKPMEQNPGLAEKRPLAARIREAAAAACEIASIAAVIVGYVVLAADTLAHNDEGGDSDAAR